MQLSVLLPKYRTWILAKVLSDLSNYWNSKEKSHIQKCSVHFGTTCLGKSHFILVNVFAVWFQRTKARTWPWFDNRLRWPISRQAIDVLEKKGTLSLCVSRWKETRSEFIFHFGISFRHQQFFLRGRLSFIISASLFFPQPFFCCSLLQYLLGSCWWDVHTELAEHK